MHFAKKNFLVHIKSKNNRKKYLVLYQANMFCI